MVRGGVGQRPAAAVDAGAEQRPRGVTGTGQVQLQQGDLTAAARDGALSVTIDALLPLEQAEKAHDRVDQGARGRVLLTIPD